MIYLFKVWELNPKTLERQKHNRIMIEAPSMLQACIICNRHPDLIEYIMNQKKERYQVIFTSDDRTSIGIEFKKYIKPFKYFPNGDYQK